MDKTQIKPGLYLAKTEGYASYNLVLEVYGESPFFRIDAWHRIQNKIIHNFDFNEAIDVVFIDEEKPIRKIARPIKVIIEQPVIR